MLACLARYDCRNNRIAHSGLELVGFAESVADARERYGAGSICVFMGTSTSGIFETERAYRGRDPRTRALPADYRYEETHSTYSLAAFVRRYLGLHGPALVVSSACSSSAKVFGNAERMISAGVCDAAVVGGVDSLCLTTLYGFHSLQLTAPGPCRPFAAGRDGMFDTRQFAQESSAGGDDQAIVGQVPRVGFEHTPAIPQTGGLGLMIGHSHAAEKVKQGHHQVFGSAQTRRYPDGARKIDKFGFRGDEVNLQTAIGRTQFAYSGQRAETGAHHGNS